MAWSPAGSGRPRVAICIPTKDKVSIDWSFAFAHLVQSAGVELGLFHRGHFEIDYARNDLVDDSLRNKFTHTFFLDSDIYPYQWGFDKEQNTVTAPFHDVIPWLLQFEYPIVSGLYWTKPGRSNLAVLRDDAFTLDNVIIDLKEAIGRWLYVDAVAIGFCLIDNRVFDKVPYPWFHYFRSPRKPDGGFDELSEDYYFFRKATQAGFPVLALGQAIALHEGRVFHTWGGDARAALPMP